MSGPALGLAMLVVLLSACSGPGRTAGYPAAATPSGSSGTARAAPGSAGAAEPGAATADVQVLLASAAGALAAARSVWVTSVGSSGASRLNAVLAVSSTGGSGVVTVAQGRFTLLRIGDVGFARADRAAWSKLLRRQAPVGIERSYVKIDLRPSGPVTTPLLAFGGVFALMSLPSIARNLITPGPSPLRLGPATQWRGTAALTLATTDRSLVVYLAQLAPGRPLALVTSGPGLHGQIDLLDYDRPVTVPPAPGRTIAARTLEPSL
jgi:hypothetical protein